VAVLVEVTPSIFDQEEISITNWNFACCTHGSG
jgi:hypothetical protein